MSALVAPAGECLRGEGLVWLTGAMVCSLCCCLGYNCSLARAMDGRVSAAAPLTLADQLPLPMIVKRGSRSVLIGGGLHSRSFLCFKIYNTPYVFTPSHVCFPLLTLLITGLISDPVITVSHFLQSKRLCLKIASLC